MEITRRKVLLEALDENEKVMRICSKNYRGLEAFPGMEDRYDAAVEKCRILRELIQALESEPVRAAVANWQRMIMEDPEGARAEAMKDL